MQGYGPSNGLHWKTGERFRIRSASGLSSADIPVSFGNDGTRLSLRNGRIVTGVPIFGLKGNLKYVVITLSTEDVIYQRYRELRKLMTHAESVRITEDDSDLQDLMGRMSRFGESGADSQSGPLRMQRFLLPVNPAPGKEVVADGIYSLSKRLGNPFVKINCSAFSANLLESELFGYERVRLRVRYHEKQACLRVANHGTIFLDEIGDFPLEHQPKLLRVLQQGELYRVGGTAPIKLDVRIIAATNADLKQKMQEEHSGRICFIASACSPFGSPLCGNARMISWGWRIISLKCMNGKYGRSLSFSPDICQLLAQSDWPEMSVSCKM